MMRDHHQIHLDHTHCRAICDEIGERLRAFMGRELAEMSPRLRSVVDRLHELDHIPSPGIVPLLEDFESSTTPEVGTEMATLG